MKKIVLLLTLFACLFSTYAQVVTTSPLYPTDNNGITLTFDASQGNAALNNFSGTIYAHTGVITSASTSVTDWKYVKTAWGANLPEVTLTSLGNSKYSLAIQPSIRQFYGVPAGESILKLAFVFRNSDGSIIARDTDGSDIYAQVYSPTDIILTSPKTDFIYNINDIVNINAVALFATQISLEINGQPVSTVSGTEINFAHTAILAGENSFKITATDGTTSKSISSTFFVQGNSTIAPLPAGVKQGANYIDNNTVTLVLYAPNKNNVLVKGSFSNWLPNSNFQMNKTADGKYFWITLNNLTANQEYTYQYVIDGTIVVADPYADKFLDYYNDPYITDITYPGLIPYPTGLTSGYVSVFQTNQTAYSWQVSDFSKPEHKNLVIYETHIRDFIKTHDYQTLIDTIGYFKNLGVNAIELMPINEFEGNSSWGYNPACYFAPDKYYGTKNKLKEFIDVCHQNNIAVIMDIVLNHAFGQNPHVRMYWDSQNNRPAADNPWFNQQSPNTAYSWGYDFNHESIDTQNFVDSVTSYWLTEYKMDGFRFDFTKGFTNTPGNGGAYDAARIAILKRMADKIWATSPNAYVILEHFTDNSEETILANYGMMIWGNLNNSYMQAAMGYSTDDNFSWISYKNRGWSQPNLVGFMESHDEERMMFKNLAYGNASGTYDVKNLATALDRVKLASLFFFSIPGPKMIWEFEELGYDVSIDDPCRVCDKPIHWEYYNDTDRMNLLLFFKQMIELKKQNPLFGTNDFSLFVSARVKQIVLRSTQENMLIVGNFGVDTQTETANFTQTGNWYEQFSGDVLNVTDVNMNLTLSAGEYRIYTDSIPTNIVLAPSNFIIYPNPAQDFIKISNILTAGTVTISDMLGKEVLKVDVEPKEITTINLPLLKRGIYFVKYKNDNEKPKIIKILKF